MFKYITVMILLMFTVNSYSQLVLQITKLTISNVESNLDSTILISEKEQDGPYLYFECSLINKSEEKVFLHPAIAKLYLSFDYNGSYYQTEIFALPFQENDSLFIEPEGKIDFFLGTNIFLGTPILSEKKNDYYRELIESLPTLELEYKELNLVLKTNKILNAKLLD